MVKISVIVPIYNKRKYIENTVTYILLQTFKDFELLLIDDGSTDGSNLLIDELAKKDERIRIFHTLNRGVSAARNLGINEAQGKYICFVDADDNIKETYLEKLYNAIVKTDNCIAVCNYYEIKNGIKHDFIYNIDEKQDNKYEIIRNNLLCVLWNKLFIRENIKHLFHENISICEDSLFCVQYYIDNAPEIVHVDDTLYGYIRHNLGLTSHIQKKSIYAINTYINYYLKLARGINDNRLKQRSLYYIYRAYLFCICTFVFENACESYSRSKNIHIINRITSNYKFLKSIKYILKCSLLDKNVEKLKPKEYLYSLLILLKMKRLIYYLARIKRCIRPYERLK